MQPVGEGNRFWRPSVSENGFITNVNSPTLGILVCRNFFFQKMCCFWFYTNIPTTVPGVVLPCLHQVKASVLLHQFLPLPGLNQAVDHSPQCLPVQTEAPPTTTLHETRVLLSTAHKKCTHLNKMKFKTNALLLCVLLSNFITVIIFWYKIGTFKLVYAG